MTDLQIIEVRLPFTIAEFRILIRTESTWHYSEKNFYHSPVKECEFCEKRVPPQFRKD